VVERTLVDRKFASRCRSTCLVRRDQNVREGDLQKFHLVAAGLAAGKGCLRDVLTRGTGFHQFRRMFAEVNYEVEILHRNFTRTGTTAQAAGTCVSGSP